MRDSTHASTETQRMPRLHQRDESETAIKVGEGRTSSAVSRNYPVPDDRFLRTGLLVFRNRGMIFFKM